MKAILFALVALGIAACASVAATGVDAGSPRRSIPVVFHDDRIVVVAPSIEQPELRFYADGAGGFNAIGGSSLHAFRVTIDFPAAVAYFELPKP